MEDLISNRDIQGVALVSEIRKILSEDKTLGEVLEAVREVNIKRATIDCSKFNNVFRACEFLLKSDLTVEDISAVLNGTSLEGARALAASPDLINSFSKFNIKKPLHPILRFLAWLVGMV
jgi:hypothetical protein